MVNPHARKLEVQLGTLARILAEASVGSSMAAKMAIMAMTTSSSISVKPIFFRTGYSEYS